MAFRIHEFCAYLTEVCEHYEKTAPTVCAWADDLYRRLDAHGDDVRVSEISVAQNLRDDSGWVPANYAANNVYKLMSRLGHDTTGHAGF